jgi:hypothetical protein
MKSIIRNFVLATVAIGTGFLTFCVLDIYLGKEPHAYGVCCQTANCGWNQGMPTGGAVVAECDGDFTMTIRFFWCWSDNPTFVAITYDEGDQSNILDDDLDFDPAWVGFFQPEECNDFQDVVVTGTLDTESMGGTVTVDAAMSPTCGDTKIVTVNPNACW